jgi:hypothetical protein
MSDLHLALLILAGVLLVALVGYNKWTERRMLRQLAEAMRGSAGDPLMQAGPTPVARATAVAPSVMPAAVAPVSEVVPDTPAVEVTDLPLSALYGGRTEPRFDPGAFAAPSDADPAAPLGALDDGVASDAADDAIAAARPASAPSPRWVEDPMIDWVLELRCAHAVDGVAVFDAAAPLARMERALPAFLVAWDARSQQWVEPDRFGFYSELLVATQLAHRKHKLDEIGASRFVALVQQIAMTLDADFDAPDVRQVVGMAQDLDQLLARFDVQIGITLQTAAGPWEPSRVAQAAAAAQLVPAGELRWARLDAGGAAVFTLAAPAARTDRLSLELDVPLTPVSADPLRSLFKAADALAVELGARLIDDNGRPVNAASLSGIAEQLDALYAEMHGAGIDPGSARARRLYG